MSPKDKYYVPKNYDGWAGGGGNNSHSMSRAAPRPVEEFLHYFLKIFFHMWRAKCCMS